MNSLVKNPAMGDLSPVFGVNALSSNSDELGEGITSGFGSISYRGKVWADKYGGIVTPHLRDDGDGTRSFIEVVLIKAAGVLSKKYYAGGYVDGSDQKPDCFSNNGVAPDSSVINKINPTCANCRMNQRGSKINENGNAVKACVDSKRMAIVPLGDIDNESKGGPMLLNIPADSLSDTAKYGHDLSHMGYPYYGVGTRISFDPDKAYPKFIYKAIRKLTEDEAEKIMSMRGDTRVASILSQSEYGSNNAGNNEDDKQPSTEPVQRRAYEQTKTKPEPKQEPAFEPKPEPAPVFKPVSRPVPKPVPKPVQKQETQEEIDAREFAEFKAAQAASRAAKVAPLAQQAAPVAKPRQVDISPARPRKEPVSKPEAQDELDEDMDEIDAQLEAMMKT